MSNVYVKFCRNCWLKEKDTFNDGIYPKNYGDDYPGYYITTLVPEDNKCRYCGQDLEDSIFTSDELWLFLKISRDYEFLEAMLKLKQEDIVEYNLKLSQFRNQVEQQKIINEQRKNDNTPKCPTCGSTNIKKISGTAKVAGAVAFGLFSRTAKSQFKCNNCGNKW